VCQEKWQQQEWNKDYNALVKMVSYHSTQVHCAGWNNSCMARLGTKVPVSANEIK